jgi:hypothetical protein
MRIMQNNSFFFLNQLLTGLHIDHHGSLNKWIRRNHTPSAQYVRKVKVFDFVFSFANTFSSKQQPQTPATMNVNRSVPTWVSMVREQDGSHSVYLEQRTFNFETLVTTANQGLCFNTEEWGIFALQIAGIDQALKLSHEENNRRLLTHSIATMCDIDEPPPLQPLPDGRKRIKKQL